MDGTHSGGTFYLCHSCSHRLSQPHSWHRLNSLAVEHTLTRVAIPTAATATKTSSTTTIIIVATLGLDGE
jgi:hypothetical protein